MATKTSKYVYCMPSCSLHTARQARALPPAKKAVQTWSILPVEEHFWAQHFSMHTKSNTISSEGPPFYNLLYFTMQVRWRTFHEMASNAQEVSRQVWYLHWPCIVSKTAVGCNKQVVLKEDIWENSSFWNNSPILYLVWKGAILRE